MIDYPLLHDDEKPNDGRKYHIGDKVEFINDQDKKVPGIVHAVTYQQGRYEIVGAQRPDMHIPEGPDNKSIPGTGNLEIVKGTENERHSFEYIMVHEDEHKAWWNIEKANQKHIKDRNHHLVKSHPELKQHIQVFEED